MSTESQTHLDAAVATIGKGLASQLLHDLVADGSAPEDVLKATKVGEMRHILAALVKPDALVWALETSREEGVDGAGEALRDVEAALAADQGRDDEPEDLTDPMFPEGDKGEPAASPERVEHDQADELEDVAPPAAGELVDVLIPHGADLLSCPGEVVRPAKTSTGRALEVKLRPNDSENSRVRGWTPHTRVVEECPGPGRPGWRRVVPETDK